MILDMDPGQKNALTCKASRLFHAILLAGRHPLWYWYWPPAWSGEWKCLNRGARTHSGTGVHATINVSLFEMVIAT